ncbi:hypothetical protein M0R45_019073 [Rubus argutus]|uniref:DUF4283 domain-containing protein n=1 Tax=Rubus argutus TaxID=59490 RepID=A0AAW1X5Z1_RUBAR
MLLGRLQLASGDKPYSPSDLQRKLSPLWGELGGWKLIPMGKGYYTFSFTSDASRAWVWAKGTIALKPGTMRFMKWVPNFSPASQKNTNAHVWVRFWNLGLEFWEARTLFEIACGVGVPIKIDPNTLDRKYGLFARVLVDVDLSANLPPELVVKRKNGETVVQGVDYEKLPDLCSHCSNIGHHVSTCKYVNPSPSLVGEQKRNGRGRSRRRRPKRNIKRATSQVYIPNHRSGKETIVDNTPTPVADSGEGPSFVRPSPEPNKDAVQDGQLQPITTSTKDTVIVLLLATASGIIQPPCTVEKTFMPIVHIEEEEQRVIELLRSNAELEVSHQDAGLLNIGLIGDNGEGDSATGTEVSDSECESIRNVDNSIGNWYDEFERQDALPEFTVVVSKATRKSMRKASKVENREAYLR